MPTIVSIQLLRAIAAIAVVLVHFNGVELMLTGRTNETPVLYPLASGVDLFFVISGFIMVTSSNDLFGAERASSLFLMKRLARIVPLYWLTTLLIIPAEMMHPTWQTLLGSLLFIPSRIPTGQIVPINGVGWTLNFEMFFYALFAVAVCWRRSIAVPALIAFMVAAVVAGAVFMPHEAILQYWSDPIILEFVFGMLIALLYVRRVSLPALVRILLICVGIGALWHYGHYIPAAGMPSGYRALFCGIPAAMIFTGTVLGKPVKYIEGGWLGSVVNLLGGASYALYLIHPLVGSMIFRMWQGDLNQFPIHHVFAGALAVAICLSIAGHLLFEKPVLRLVQNFLRPRRSVIPSQAETPDAVASAVSSD